MDEIVIKRVGEIVSVSVGDKTSGLVVEGISASELFDDGMSSSLTNVMKFVKSFEVRLQREKHLQLNTGKREVEDR